MITVQLDKTDLITLLMGTQGPPMVDVMSEPFVSMGRFWGGFQDKWEWDRSKMELMTEEQLGAVYGYLKYVREQEQDAINKRFPKSKSK